MRNAWLIPLLYLWLTACQEVAPSSSLDDATITMSASRSAPEYELVLFAGTENTGAATDINDAGEIVGYFSDVETGGGTSRNFRWTRQDGISGLPGTSSPRIVNSGKVLVHDGSAALIVQGTSVTAIEWGPQWHDYVIGASSLSNDGTVVGSLHRQGSADQEPFVWTQQRGIERLPQLDSSAIRSASAIAVNSRGAVTGFSGSADALATVWIDNKPITLFPSHSSPRCAEGWGVAINESGAIVGGCDQLGRAPRSAFYWTPKDGGRLLSPPDDHTFAHDLNNRGEVVGFYRPFIPSQGYLYGYAYRWTESDGFVAIDSSSTENGSTVSTAFAINDRGWIVGTACRPTGCHPALWVPKGTANLPRPAASRRTHTFSPSQLARIVDRMNEGHSRRFARR